MSKANYISLINTKLPDGANIPSTDHRDTMYGDANSIGELVYGDILIQTDISSTILTPSSVDLEYTLNFTKVGRNINCSGTVTNGSSSFLRPSFTITDDDYKCVADSVFNGFGYIEEASQGLEVQTFNALGSSAISLIIDLAPSENVVFSITYASNL